MTTEFLEAARPAAERVGWTLVHSTWEGAAVALVLWVALAAMGRTSARRRYAGGCLALAAVVVATVVTFARVEGTRRAPGGDRPAGVPVAADLRVADRAIPVPTDVPPTEPERRSAGTGSWDVRARIAPWLPGVVGAWAVGVVVFAAWHVGGWATVRRMTREASAGPWQDRARAIAARMGVSRGVRVVESAMAGVPAVVGFVRPVILLPVGLAADMSVAQVEAILAHELAHVRRNDYLVNLVQTAVETLLFYHPAVWWISGQIRQEREHCCDDLAVVACGDRAGYARALARVEELRDRGVRLAPAADGGGSLLKRVRRIAGAQPTRGGRAAAPIAAGLGAVACAAAVLFAAQWSANAANRAPSPATTRPGTAPAAPAATEEQWNGLRVSPVRPEDLVPAAAEYRITETDLLTITFGTAAGDRDLTRRVGEDGNVDLPDVGKVKAAGMAEAELGRAVAEAMRARAPGGEARVSVRVAEARGNSFMIVGPGVDHPGQYPITRPDFRLSDAIAVAGVPGKRAVVHVMRGQGDERRVMNVTAAALAGDRKHNLIIRQRDTLFVDDPDRRFLRVIVGRDTITLDKKPTNLDGVREALRAIPADERARADVSVLAESDDVPVGRLMWVLNTCTFEAGQLGMPEVKNLGVVNAMKRVVSTQPATRSADVVGTFYVGGRVREPGVYGINPGGITLARALASAGVYADAPAFVTVVRPSGDRQVVVTDGIPARDITDGTAGDVAIRSGDRVTVRGEKPSASRRGVAIRPAPRAGEIGEVYLGGHVHRPGIYSVSGRKVTLAGLVTMALGPDNDAADLTEVRRRDPGHEEVIRVSLRKVLEGTEPDLYLQPKDEVNVGVRAPSPDPAGK